MQEGSGRIVWLAIIAGYLADLLISTVILAIGASIDPTVLEQLHFDSTAAIVTGLLLVVATGLGGWLAGRIAKQEHVLHGVIVGGAGLLLLLVQSFGSTPISLETIVLQCLAVLVGGLGGWLSQRFPTRRQE